MGNMYCIAFLLFFTQNILLSTSSHKSIEITQVTAPIQQSEGPHWDYKNGILYFVDTFKAIVMSWNPAKDIVASHKLEGRDSVGIIIPIQGKSNEFIVGADRYLFKLSWDGTTNNSGTVSCSRLIEENKVQNQFNDGKCDAKGNLWIGTLTRLADLTVAPNGGSLYRVLSSSATDGVKFNFEEKITNSSISNGMAFTKDSKTMFWVDSDTKKVFAYDLDVQSGTIKNSTRTVFFDLEENNLEGIPDGLTIDSNDDLWLALHGGHAVVQIEAKTGKLKQTIRMPATYVTSVCFGGDNLDTLFVTTSRLLLNATDIQKEPLAGSVFAVKGLGVRGLQSNEVVITQK